MNTVYITPEEFAKEFRENPQLRSDLIERLIAGTGRILLTIPRYGIARRISILLREGSFSDFYEFEKGLASRLHPFMARLNLTIFADIQINVLFNKRYEYYSDEVKRALARVREPDMGSLRDTILAMTENDGHYMVVKFYDLVLRNINAGLFRELQPVELCVIRIRKGLGDNGERNREMAMTAVREFAEQRGEGVAALLIERMGWDGFLKEYIPARREDSNEALKEMPEPAAAGQLTRDEEADYSIGENDTKGGTVVSGSAATGQEGRILKYAEIVRCGHLDPLEPDDEGGIRRVVEEIFRKNERRFGANEAGSILNDLLRIWADDSTIEGPKRRVLAMILEEGSGGDHFGGADADGNVSTVPDEPDTEAEDDSMGGTLPREHVDGDEFSGSGDAAPAGTETIEDEDAFVDDGFLIEESGFDRDISSENSSTDDEGLDDTYLIAGDELTEIEVSDNMERAEVADDGDAGLAEDFGPGETFVSSDRDRATFPDEADRGEQFVVRDEILFEDASLRNTRRKKRGGGNDTV